MKKINEKGFTLVELLAVIVVLAIVMALAVVAITDVVDDTRRKGFVTDAKSFLYGAHQLVTSDSSDLFGNTNKGFAPPCTSSTGTTSYIPIAAINLDSGGVNSPYNNEYKKGDKVSTGSSSKPVKDGKTVSFIEVTAIVNETTLECDYTYKIYLTDGVYSIGTNSGPIEEDAVDTSKVGLDKST